MNTTKILDKRPARTNLTSRECAKIFNSVIFGCYAIFGEDAVYRSLLYLVEAKTPWEVIAVAAAGQPNRMLIERAKRERATYFGDEMNEAHCCEMIFGGLIGGLCGMANVEDVKTAVKFVHDNSAKGLEIIIGKLEELYE